MTGTGQLLFMAAMGVVLGVCGGYPWGRVLRRRDADAAWNEGYDYARTDYKAEVMPVETVHERERSLPGLVSSGGLPSLAGGPPDRDWREQVAAELAPEALALENVPEPEPGSLVSDGRGDTSLGLGHPSPYAGILTPAQRRRDKHKQRGQYAPQPGWTLEEANILSPHWKPEGDRWVAEWRIEWQDDVAAVDEEIAGWVERQRAWLAADRWDRGARRLGAVA